MKKGILVVSFGTSYTQTRKDNIEKVEQTLQEAFPQRFFYHAYTSGMIRKKLWQRDHLAIPSVKEAMQTLLEDGITDLLVQPTHIINGVENDQMKEDIISCAPSSMQLYFGTPLLTSTADHFDLINQLKSIFPFPSAKEALLFMGHGSTHYVNTTYAALDYCCKEQWSEHTYVGTVEAYPYLETIVPTLRKKGYRKIYLSPLMLVAGDHALNDLAGEEADSWKSKLEAEGFVTECILKGLGEYEGIRNMYVKHAQAALKVQ